MIKRFFLKLLIISFVLLSFLTSPSQAHADSCFQCDAVYKGCILACGNVAGPLCSVPCSIARDKTCTCSGPPTPAELQNHCKDHPDDPDCKVPASNGDFCDANHIRTAIGCIPTQPGMFFPALIKYSYAVGGGIALLLMIIGAFQMITSAGNPEAIKKGREQFIAASTGLVFILISTLLLRIIGVDILGIPGF